MFKRRGLPRGIRHEVFIRDNYSCKQCGSKDRIEVDHIIPLQFGGTDEMSNLQTLCKTCNRDKNDLIHQGIFNPRLCIVCRQAEIDTSCVLKCFWEGREERGYLFTCQRCWDEVLNYGNPEERKQIVQ